MTIFKSFDTVVLTIKKAIYVDGSSINIAKDFIAKYKKSLKLECKSLLDDIDIIETTDSNSSQFIESWIAIVEQSTVVIDNTEYALYVNNEGDLIGVAKKEFQSVKKFRPQAVRRCSKECYIICLGFKA